LAESYANLSRDYENLQFQYREILRVHEDVCDETKLLKKTLLVLQSLVSTLLILPSFLEHNVFPSLLCCNNKQMVQVLQFYLMTFGKKRK